MKALKKISLLFITAVLITAGCANPFRTKSRCEILCEQMHSECNMSCPTDHFDSSCHERCDSFRDCKATCDKPLFKEGSEEENEEEE
ncbi:MAG TPA: hypothetical protein P5120_12585 [Spirochaetota bacterium]|nr:hypothetical protein [Spirochaetota bacterium]HPF07288.1 hypothetical protein [Spirochaetota bacterium]HPJ42100.1 hypothetical protein [Spirochaetota bacterium]HPR38564.1 hypothetical protein [Spirochaetota bacterium]HRX48348.1 hypothetical protein [Spirochaetota bacterium]